MAFDVKHKLKNESFEVCRIVTLFHKRERERERERERWQCFDALLQACCSFMY